MTADNDNGNQRMTLALLGQKLDYVIVAVSELKDTLTCLDTTVDTTAHQVAINTNRLSVAESEIEKLRSRSERGDVIAYVAAAVAAVLGAIGIGTK
jgi:hypothetical protein